MPRFSATLAVAGATALGLVVAAGYASVVRIEAGEHFIKFRLGAIVDAGVGPGTVLRVPLLERLRSFDAQPRQFASEPDAYRTSDQACATLAFEFEWRIIDVQRFFVATGGDAGLTTGRLGELVSTALHRAVAKTASADIADAVPALGTDVRGPVDDAAAELGVAVKDMALGLIKVPCD